MDDVRTYTGTLIADLILSHVRSLKERRGPLRSLVQRLRNDGYTVAQVGPADLKQRVFLAIAVVSGTEGRVEAMLDEAERKLYAGEFEVGEIRRRLTSETFPSVS